jgi:ubiquinone/menaquinone biosynthesis C-methylase UbiE
MQSVLCFNDKSRLLREVYRVLKTGGQVGANESTWLQPPTPETTTVTRATICETFQHAVETSSWVSFLLEAGFSDVNSKTYEFTSMSPYQMLREEGLIKTFKIMTKVLLNPELNMRLGAVSTYFKTFHGYFGYGLYVGHKNAT